MKVDIVSDTICPWCYIGKRRFERALSSRPDIEVAVTWRPFQLNPNMPVEGLDRATYLVGKFGSEERVQEIFDSITDAGRGEDIPFAFDRISRAPNTVASHRLIRWAGEAGRQNEAVEVLFRRYFEDGRDIGDVGVLAELAAEAGLDRDEALAYLNSDEGAEEVKAEASYVSRLGISGVPCFILDGKYAVSGAQEPEVFVQALDLSLQKAQEAETGTVETGTAEA